MVQGTPTRTAIGLTVAGDKIRELV
jgi:hypothetical protein